MHVQVGSSSAPGNNGERVYNFFTALTLRTPHITAELKHSKRSIMQAALAKLFLAPVRKTSHLEKQSLAKVDCHICPPESQTLQVIIGGKKDCPQGGHCHSRLA
jgi:hypothetical protein